MKGRPGFSLLLMVKSKRKEKFWKKLLNKKEPALNGLENSQPIPILSSGNSQGHGRKTMLKRLGM